MNPTTPSESCFTDAVGARYRVLDARMHNGAMVVANPPVAWATFRIFGTEEGQRLLHYFGPGETRLPVPALLEQEPARAEYLPTQVSGSRIMDPR